MSLGLGLKRQTKAFLGCSRGATAIEYALIAGSLSIVILAAVFSIGTQLEGIFRNLVEAFAE